MKTLVVFLLKNFLDAVDLHLAQINLILVLTQLKFPFLCSFCLFRTYLVKLLSHILNLEHLSVVDIGLARNLLVAILDFLLAVLVLGFCLPQVVFILS